MRHAIVFLTLPMFAAAAIATACSHGGAATADDPDAGDPSAVTPATTPASSPPPAASGAAGTGLNTGLPCDVQAILENRCIGCHGGTTVNGPPTLLTYDDLATPSKMDPAKTRAQMALQLLQSKTMPPAPAVPADDDEIAAFATWVNAGTPRNPTACTDPPPPASDAGADADAAPNDAVDAGVACTSGKFWTQGDDGSPLMHPGGACNTCHQKNDGPNLRIGGTVFSGPHQPDDCNGSAPPPQLTVIVTDAQRHTYRMAVNEVGNFLTTQKVKPPLRAQVTDGKNTRSMNGSVTSGDCNSCHTVAGANGAPGRILAP